MELVILLAVFLSASLIESIFSIALRPRDDQRPEPKSMDEHLESRFARLEMDRGEAEAECA